jgi:immunomodulating metalloprotease
MKTLLSYPVLQRFSAMALVVILASCGGGGGGDSSSAPAPSTVIATSTPDTPAVTTPAVTTSTDTTTPATVTDTLAAATPASTSATVAVVTPAPATPVTVAPVTVAPVVPTQADLDVAALATALASGNSSGVSLPVVMSALQNKLGSQMMAFASTRQALFGLNANGSANASSLSGIDWNATHDSVYFTLLDQARNQAILPSNWRYTGTAAGTNKTLAVVGKVANSSARYAAFGGNPMAVPGNAKMDLLVKNTVVSLTGQSSGSNLKVVTAHLPGSATYWFPHEAKVRTWLTAQFPGITINGLPGAQATTDDTCDGDKLDACLQGANLLVIGRQQSRNIGNSTSPDVYPAGYNSDTVMQAVTSAQARGIAVLYLHHYRDSNDLASRMMSMLGLETNNNYFGSEGLLGFNPANASATPGNTAELQALLQRLDTGSFSTNWSGCFNDVGRVLCESSGSNVYDAALTNEFATIAKSIRSTLRTLDSKGTAIFSQPGYETEKLLVLMGDKYRQLVSYPMTKEASGKDFFKAYFSDMTAYVNRPHTAVARNLGNYSNLFPAATTALSKPVTVAAPEVGNKDYMTGLYVMPGRTMTLTRTDGGTSSVSMGLNMLRDTTRVYQSYDRPTMLASPRVPLVKDKPMTITSPFGGPVYLFLGSASGAPAVSVQIDGVITHPVLRNVNDPAQVAAFKVEVATTPTNWVGITTDFLTVHSNLTNFKRTLTAYGDDITKLTSNIWTYMVKDTYELAGFNSATPGTFALPTPVTAFCNDAGWDCTGLQHRRDSMQHVISDNYAQCGAGCSGNPYDQNWALEPLGWGETHEIGHNLQRGRLNIYGGQSGEVSNNIFPSHKQAQFNKANPALTPMARSGTSAQLAFDVIKAGRGTADPFSHVYNAIWSDTAYAANNGLRLSFYRQLVEYARSYNTRFSDGWELYTLLYLLDRNVTSSVSKGTWAADASKFGFGNYTSNEVAAMNGNDFMLIASSRIIGKDMRAVFTMWGVTFSAAANSQVTTNVLASGALPADKLVFPMNNVNQYGAGVGAALNMATATTYP